MQIREGVPLGTMTGGDISVTLLEWRYISVSYESGRMTLRAAITATKNGEPVTDWASLALPSTLYWAVSPYSVVEARPMAMGTGSLMVSVSLSALEAAAG